ncbi:hypothetical protein BDV96DRAFT_562163 [Lophiotrema nucula]|uniref:Uncharacterized protein n=1 Tax=Lophiotrema nucula TaxID=690887 RepID=A0A6A5ZW33_9PLEO|nr:hypothetical protein BDV96DRAFT_562163 [Lophiotrema nucula]
MFSKVPHSRRDYLGTSTYSSLYKDVTPAPGQLPPRPPKRDPATYTSHPNWYSTFWTTGLR